MPQNLSVLPYPLILSAVLVMTLGVAWWRGWKRAHVVAVAAGGGSMHSRPGYYGTLTALWCAVPLLTLVILWHFAEDALLGLYLSKGLSASAATLSPEQLHKLTGDIAHLAAGGMVPIQPELKATVAKGLALYQHMQMISNLALAVGLLAIGLAVAHVAAGRIRPALRARNQVELVVKALLALSSTFAIFVTIGIVLSVLFESIRFFQQIPLTDFLFGLKWSPQMAIRADQVGSSGTFGAIPVLTGTFLISGIAMAIAVPFGLMSAIYLSEYAKPRVRAIVKPLLEILAGIPTVVYGFFAALVVAPFIRDMGYTFGLSVSSESALAAGLVMGIMIIPFVSSLSDDVINAVPQSLRDGSYGLGATQSETIKLVIIPAALPGIVGSVLLAVSRAIGETMIVVMAAGLAANLTANPLQAVTTVTVQIVTLLVGDQEFDSPKTLAAFALGMLLFVITLILNVIALYVVRKYREEYE